jgi:imidazolonepropionase-like amidohydrolase
MTGLLLENCSLVDVRAGSSLADAAVLLDGDRIAAAGPRAEVEAPADVERLDLGGAYVAPGLINCHVHFGLLLPGEEGDRLRGETDAELVLRMAADAAATLRAGVTTVRLLGERPYVDIALRESIARKQTLGPRVVTSGPVLTSTGGHGSELDSCIEADGADGFRAATRTQIKHGVDWVKIGISGGIAGPNEAIADAQMTAEEMLAVTETAHARGKRVAAHAGPAAVIATAVECGVDTIEHGYFLTDEVAALMARSGVWLVPTINVTRAADFFRKIGAPPWMVERALAAGELHWAGLRSAIANRVRIAMGTDMMPHEPFDGTSVTVRELEFYVDAGMTPAAALRTATCEAAEMLGLDEVGEVRAGAVADLIVVARDPTGDISALRDVRQVISQGRVL